MSQYYFDCTKSQYSCLDENLSIYSTSSKSKQGKYFTRKPIQNYSPRVPNTSRKHRDSSNFAGFYSPTQKYDILTQKNIYQKALKVNTKKINTLGSDQTFTKTHQYKFLQNQQDIVNKLVPTRKSFRKKKPQTPTFNHTPAQSQIEIQSEILIQSQNVHKLSHNNNQFNVKQNPQKIIQQFQFLLKENIKSREQIQRLQISNNELQNRINELINNNPLQKQIKKLFVQLTKSNCYSTQLQTKIQELKLKNIEMEKNEEIVNESHQAAIESVNKLNHELRLEVYHLKQSLKYSGIRISILIKSQENESRDNSLLLKQKQQLKKQNQELKLQLIRLKEVRKREKEMWRDWEERQQIQFCISDTEECDSQ